MWRLPWGPWGVRRAVDCSGLAIPDGHRTRLEPGTPRVVTRKCHAARSLLVPKADVSPLKADTPRTGVPKPRPHQACSSEPRVGCRSCGPQARDQHRSFAARSSASVRSRARAFRPMRAQNCHARTAACGFRGRPRCPCCFPSRRCVGTSTCLARGMGLVNR